VDQVVDKTFSVRKIILRCGKARIFAHFANKVFYIFPNNVMGDIHRGC
jgi:hypothetical protein